MADLSRDALKQMAALCGVALDDQEMDRLQPNLAAVLRGVEGVLALDPGGVDPYPAPPMPPRE